MIILIITEQNLKVIIDDQIQESENFHQTSILEKKKIIKKLKNSNSVGWDNIPSNILKTNVKTLAPILSNLINKSLAQGLFPQSLKRAKILPIFRSKDKLNIANYRPISFLPVIGKGYDFFIVDSITISSQIIYYYPHNLTFDQKQLSTEHAL